MIQKDSAALIEDFDELRHQRVMDDQGFRTGPRASRRTGSPQDQVWFSASVQRELRQPRSFLVTHFFNHQTHHRGQAHALITACGEKTGDTDLFLVVPQPV